MNVLDCINSKRSIRKYKEDKIPKEVLKQLITLGTKASTGSGLEPWGFVIIQNQEEINHWSAEIKHYLAKNLHDYPYLKQYESWLANPQFNVFNHADTLLIIYGNTDSHWYKYDCTLAAGNIMLAAHDMGIGTCWIGFAEYMLNTREFKEQYHIPENYELVCPLSMGYEINAAKPPTRKEPIIFNA
jgi:nitroreductase